MADGFNNVPACVVGEAPKGEQDNATHHGLGSGKKPARKRAKKAAPDKAENEKAGE